MTWWLNTKKHYKIWFSNDPDTFLGMENQVRFIRAIEKNPNASFGFVYSSAKLSNQACAKLKIFCEQYKITPLDFDKEIPDLLKHDSDKEIYQIAKQEMQSKEGSLASASDCTRILIPVIEKLGIYSDFDVVVNFSTKPERIAVKYPVIMPVDSDEKKGLQVNIDFLAVAEFESKSLSTTVESKTHSTHSPSPVECIRAIQLRTINKYANASLGLSTPLFKGLGTLIDNIPLAHILVNNFFQKNPKATVFQLRKYLAESKENYQFKIHQETISLNGQESKKLRSFIRDRSVIDFSGANSYAGIYESFIPKDGFTSKNGSLTPSDNWKSLVSAMKNSSLDHNDLRSCVITGNNISTVGMKLSEAKSIDAGVRDSSWTECGREKMKEREAKLFSAAQKILNFYLKKRTTGTGKVSRLIMASLFGAPLHKLPRELKDSVANTVSSFSKSQTS